VATDLLGGADEMTACVLDESECLREERIETFALLIAILELLGHARKILVGKIPGLVLFFNAVDLMNDRPDLLEFTLVFSTEK
jgi:hypothetical protein